MKARSLLAVLLAALLVPAAATAAPARAQAASTAPLEGLSVGGFVGYETDDVSGISLRFDGELPFRALAPQVNLSWVGSLGYSRLSDDEGGVDFTVNLVKIIPAARFSFPLNRQFTLFADGGLGLYYASWTIETPVITNPFTGERIGGGKFDDSEFSIMMRIGGGAFYQVNEQTRVGAMLEFDPLFGDIDQTTFLIQAGVMFRL